MKSIVNKTKGNQKPTENLQTVAMIVYVNGKSKEPRAFWANYDMDVITHSVELYNGLLKDYPEFRSTLYDYLIKDSLLDNPEAIFYNCAMTHICGDKSIQKKIQRFPNGGWAIIGHYNYNDNSLQKFQFLDPETFKNHLNSDYTILPFNGKESGFILEADTVICENLNEAMFLSGLIELIKISDYSSCHLSNDELISYVPGSSKNQGWIETILGKIFSLGILGIIEHDFNGTIWYRDLFLKHQVNHVLYAFEQKRSA